MRENTGISTIISIPDLVEEVSYFLNHKRDNLNKAHKAFTELGSSFQSDVEKIEKQIKEVSKLIQKGFTQLYSKSELCNFLSCKTLESITSLKDNHFELSFRSEIETFEPKRYFYPYLPILKNESVTFSELYKLLCFYSDYIKVQIQVSEKKINILFVN